MDGHRLPVRYWDFDGPMPPDATEGRITTGIAYLVEREERLAYVRVTAQNSGLPAWEMWLDRDTARELTASLRMLEPWFEPASAGPEGEAGGGV
jgi:hypothetical protein